MLGGEKEQKLQKWNRVTVNKNDKKWKKDIKQFEAFKRFKEESKIKLTEKLKWQKC